MRAACRREVSASVLFAKLEYPSAEEARRAFSLLRDDLKVTGEIALRPEGGSFILELAAEKDLPAQVFEQLGGKRLA